MTTTYRPGTALTRWGWFYLPPIAYGALIFFASSRSKISLFDRELVIYDKLAHACEFALLALLIYRAFMVRQYQPASWGLILLAFGLASFYGAVDELHQYFVPGRNSDWNDWLADTVGAALALLPLWVAGIRFSRSRGISPLHR